LNQGIQYQGNAAFAKYNEVLIPFESGHSISGLLREALPRLVKGIVYDKIEQELSK